MSTNTQSPTDKCGTCGHATPHQRVGPIRDLNGHAHADACEDCDCINRPAYRVPDVRRSPRFGDCGGTPAQLRPARPQTVPSPDVEGDDVGFVRWLAATKPDTYAYWRAAYARKQKESER